MSNPLVETRDSFANTHPEQTHMCGDRTWGIIRAGNRGPALVLLPGTLGRADIFWQQIEALEDEARILALSYPAAGGIAVLAADVASMVKEFELEGAVILGSSLGGYIAQYTAACHADLFGALIAANTLPDASVVRGIPPYMLDLEAVEISVLADGFLGGLRNWMTEGNPYCHLAELLAAEVKGRIPEGELRNRLIALKTAPAIPSQHLPPNRIFTVESDDDHLIPLPIRQALRDALKPAHSYNLGQASHFPYVTKPSAYTDMLKQVLGL